MAKKALLVVSDQADPKGSIIYRFAGSSAAPIEQYTYFADAIGLAILVDSDDKPFGQYRSKTPNEIPGGAMLRITLTRDGRITKDKWYHPLHKEDLILFFRSMPDCVLLVNNASLRAVSYLLRDAGVAVKLQFAAAN
jgi:hypothetical protein